MSTDAERVLVVSKKPIKEYLIEIALLFQESAEVVVLKGHGRFISKAVDLYNAVLYRMKDSVELVNVSIGSDVVKGKVKPYIAIKIKRRY
ncbi:MAG: DNA-binding protein [Desulfurococcaceae archaeon]